MLSKDAQNLNTDQLDTRAAAYFTALFNRPEVTNLVITPTYSNPHCRQLQAGAQDPPRPS